MAAASNPSTFPSTFTVSLTLDPLQPETFSKIAKLYANDVIEKADKAYSAAMESFKNASEEMGEIGPFTRSFIPIRFKVVALALAKLPFNALIATWLARPSAIAAFNFTATHLTPHLSATALNIATYGAWVIAMVCIMQVAARVFAMATQSFRDSVLADPVVRTFKKIEITGQMLSSLLDTHTQLITALCIIRNSKPKDPEPIAYSSVETSDCTEIVLYDEKTAKERCAQAYSHFVVYSNESATSYKDISDSEWRLESAINGLEHIIHKQQDAISRLAEQAEIYKQVKVETTPADSTPDTAPKETTEQVLLKNASIQNYLHLI